MLSRFLAALFHCRFPLKVKSQCPGRFYRRRTLDLQFFKEFFHPPRRNGSPGSDPAARAAQGGALHHAQGAGAAQPPGGVPGAATAGNCQLRRPRRGAGGGHSGQRHCAEDGRTDPLGGAAPGLRAHPVAHRLPPARRARPPGPAPGDGGAARVRDDVGGGRGGGGGGGGGRRGRAAVGRGGGGRRAAARGRQLVPVHGGRPGGRRRGPGLHAQAGQRLRRGPHCLPRGQPGLLLRGGGTQGDGARAAAAGRGAALGGALPGHPSADAARARGCRRGRVRRRAQRAARRAARRRAHADGHGRRRICHRRQAAQDRVLPCASSQMENLPNTWRLSRTDVEAFVPLTLLSEEASATARRARELEEHVGSAVDALVASEGDDLVDCDRGYTAIRAAAYMGWKASEQAAHVAQAAAGVLACASMARVLVAVQRHEQAVERATRSLRAPMVQAWRDAAAPGPDDARAAHDEQEDSESEEAEPRLRGRASDSSIPPADEPDRPEAEAEAEDEDEGPRAQRDSMWRLYLDGCDWWSARTALAKARTRSRVARALARALVELRALYRPLENVAIASWDARCQLHSKKNSNQQIDQDAASELAAAAGGACGAVRRLLREVQRMHSALHRALQSFVAAEDLRLAAAGAGVDTPF